MYIKRVQQQPVRIKLNMIDSYSQSNYDGTPSVSFAHRLNVTHIHSNTSAMKPRSCVSVYLNTLFVWLMEAAHLVNDLRIVALVARYRCIVQVETQASMEWMYERIWGEGEIQNYAQPKYNVFFRFEYWWENRSNWAIIFRWFFYSFICTFLFPFFSSFIIVFCNLSLSLFRRLRIFDVFFSFVFFRSFGFFEPFGFMRFVGFFLFFWIVAFRLFFIVSLQL